MRLSNDMIERFQLQDSFDFLRLHEGDLTSIQSDTVKNLRKVQHERGLQDTEIKQLSDIVKSLKKSAKVLIVRKYY